MDQAQPDCFCLRLLNQARNSVTDLDRLIISTYGNELVDSLSAARDFTEVADKAYDDAEVPAADNTYCCPNTHPERAPMVNIPKCFYDGKALLLDGSEVCMREICQGKVCIVVNVASFCGLTVTEYNQMNDLIDKFPCDKFQILAFPCNQFCFEENAYGEDEILNMLKHVRPGKGFVPKATMFDRIDVNGKDALPLFEYLKREIPCPVDDPLYLLKHETWHYWDPLFRYDITGNFEKFLIDTSGKVVKRYSPMYQMKYLDEDICQLLGTKRDDLDGNRLSRVEESAKRDDYVQPQADRMDDSIDESPSPKDNVSELVTEVDDVVRRASKRDIEPAENPEPAKKAKLEDFVSSTSMTALSGATGSDTYATISKGQGKAGRGKFGRASPGVSTMVSVPDISEDSDSLSNDGHSSAKSSRPNKDASCCSTLVPAIVCTYLPAALCNPSCTQMQFPNGGSIVCGHQCIPKVCQFPNTVFLPNHNCVTEADKVSGRWQSILNLARNLDPDNQVTGEILRSPEPGAPLIIKSSKFHAQCKQDQSRVVDKVPPPVVRVCGESCAAFELFKNWRPNQSRTSHCDTSESTKEDENESRSISVKLPKQNDTEETNGKKL